MDALKGIHRWLRPGGVLLDLHPEAEDPRIDVVSGGTSTVQLGRMDSTTLIGNIRAARAALASLVDQRWFERERSVVFDFIFHFATVDEWFRHRQERRESRIVDPELIERAREVLASASQGELLVSEHVLATRLRRSTPRSARI